MKLTIPYQYILHSDVILVPIHVWGTHDSSDCVDKLFE